MNAVRFKRYWMPIVVVAPVAFLFAAVVGRGGGVPSLPQPQADVQRCSAGLDRYDTADRGPVRVGRSALLHAPDGAGGL